MMGVILVMLMTTLCCKVQGTYAQEMGLDNFLIESEKQWSIQRTIQQGVYWLLGWNKEQIQLMHLLRSAQQGNLDTGMKKELVEETEGDTGIKSSVIVDDAIQMAFLEEENNRRQDLSSVNRVLQLGEWKNMAIQ